MRGRDVAITTDHLIIGGGCAGLSLARMLPPQPSQGPSSQGQPSESPPSKGQTLVVEAHPRKQDHSWGFFVMDELADAAAMARKSWTKWQIITPDAAFTQHSTNHPYAGLESKAWLTHCRGAALANGVKFTQAIITAISDQGVVDTDHGAIKAGMIYDSRPPSPPDGAMIQHFIGHEVETPRPVFDPDCAVLMDFRCDQSRGIHFIYVLPYSDRRALIESTMFSPKLEDDGFYETAIASYLKDQLKVDNAMVLRREKGAIPMAEVGRAISGGPVPVIPIGARGGAIRPSSGYAFGFIQQQITALTTALSADKLPSTTSPHQPIDLMMDRLFLKVIARRPSLAPRLFAAMAKALNGDEMALFMSGRATMGLRLKVILAMPKWPFIMALVPTRGGRP
ncbi:MAG: lycopene cyclase [Alphaproteobacteria bacterium]|nr:lycopene cyclase [Alphaproteobacteria bacterium]